MPVANEVKDKDEIVQIMLKAPRKRYRMGSFCFHRLDAEGKEQAYGMPINKAKKLLALVDEGNPLPVFVQVIAGEPEPIPEPEPEVVTGVKVVSPDTARIAEKPEIISKAEDFSEFKPKPMPSKEKVSKGVEV